MKKAVLFIVIAVSISGFAQAQISTGRTLLGGTLSFSQAKEKYVSTNISPTQQTVVTINPSVGRVIKENLVLGVDAGFSRNRLVYNYDYSKSESETRVYGGSVFLRKYVPLLQRFYFFGQGTAGFSKNNTTQSSSQSNVTAAGWSTSLSITPGLTYGITKKFYVEAGLNSLLVLGYNHQESKNADTGTGTVSRFNSNSINFSTSLGSSGAFNIGFRYLL